jgi:hypothetical protein
LRLREKLPEVLLCTREEEYAISPGRRPGGRAQPADLKGESADVDPAAVESFDSHSAAAQTRQIQRRRVALAIVFGILPFAVLAYRCGPWELATRNALLLSWVALYALVTLRVAWSRCPRCRRLYFVAKPFFRVNPLRNRCGTCGWALSDTHS